MESRKFQFAYRMAKAAGIIGLAAAIILVYLMEQFSMTIENRKALAYYFAMGAVILSNLFFTIPFIRIARLVSIQEIELEDSTKEKIEKLLSLMIALYFVAIFGYAAQQFEMAAYSELLALISFICLLCDVLAWMYIK